MNALSTGSTKAIPYRLAKAACNNSSKATKALSKEGNFQTVKNSKTSMTKPLISITKDFVKILTILDVVSILLLLTCFKTKIKTLKNGLSFQGLSTQGRKIPI